MTPNLIITCSPDKTTACDAEIVFDTPQQTDNCSGVPVIVVVSTSTDKLTRT
jgi:hypothetical protein